MRKLVIGLLGATALCAASAANAVINVDFGSAPGNLGTDHDYSTSAGTITASGYDDSNVDGDLYGKNSGGNEQGLGLADDPSTQNEIFAGHSTNGSFVQIDLTDVLANITMAQFFMNSTTNGESWFVIGTNNDACGIICSDATLIAFGTDQGSSNLHTLWGGFDYYDFYASGLDNSGAESNVLLGGLVLTPVPEPATWAMMLLGFGALGIAFRRRRRVTVTLPQLA